MAPGEDERKFDAVYPWKGALEANQQEVNRQSSNGEASWAVVDSGSETQRANEVENQGVVHKEALATRSQTRAHRDGRDERSMEDVRA